MNHESMNFEHTERKKKIIKYEIWLKWMENIWLIDRPGIVNIYCINYIVFKKYMLIEHVKCPNMYAMYKLYFRTFNIYTNILYIVN